MRRTKRLISVNVMFKRDVNGCQAFNSEYSRSGTEMADTRPMKILSKKFLPLFNCRAVMAAQLAYFNSST